MFALHAGIYIFDLSFCVLLFMNLYMYMSLEFYVVNFVERYSLHDY